ncbi:hypothetical protein C8Q77DRAFT_253278 [Trametes polyzona]|nr:hypothetical protein C8Q77DRAFT_253278 [Trametes polyzona]
MEHPEEVALRVLPPPASSRTHSQYNMYAEAVTPNSSQDVFTTSHMSLPFSGPHHRRGADEKSVLRRPEGVHSGAAATREGRGRRSRMRLKLVHYYDLVYYRLKQRRILFCSLLIAGIIGSSLGIGWAFRLKTFNIADPDNMHNSIVQLSANIVDVDPSKQEMTLDWLINYDCESIGCPDANIFFDSNTLRMDSSDSQTPSNVKPDPIFTVIGRNVLAMRNNTDRRASSLTFRTDVAISNAHTHRTLQSYPFDEYATQLVFFSENAATNESIAVSIVKTTGLAVGFNIQLRNPTDIKDDFGTVIKNIEVTRGRAVRIYAIFIVLVIWLVTLTFMIICVLSVFFGKGISSGVLVLPMGTLFAFTQLRSTLPGAPDGFGAVIDFMGVLPCLAILTICSVFMTAIFLFRDPECDVERWHWKKPGEGRRRSTA